MPDSIAQILSQLRGYGSLITSVISVIFGGMVEIRNELGIVEAMTNRIVLRSFDGRTVCIPTALAMTSPIRNYSTLALPRVQVSNA